MGRGQRAPGRGAGRTKVRQSALVYAAHCREDRNAPDVITGTFFIDNLPYTALIDVGSMYSYIACNLVKHQVNLDCVAKWVVLKTVEGNEIVVIGERQNYFSNVISTLMVEKLVCKGCEAYLAYIIFSDSEISSIKDIGIVKDFPDLFPDELTGLHRNREVEFGIELLLGIALVSIVPYRMAPKELVELKA
ncbi:uncharacterized protein [Gossypium hirsutum]|uniref:Uncharacterized protein n=1 Tax=Gossypium hirsutum TaxID=3635 RepID=A0A1U8IDW5_GOSHI|nr:uncharacterized protein LOC107895651 [Gossypium hirsutum]